MISIEPLVFAGLVFASAADIECKVPKAPFIDIAPDFGEIRYDYTQSEKTLTAKGSDTVNPYDEGVKTVTHGLREDKPVVKTEVKIGIGEYKSLGVGCFWYDSVRVEIKMSPTIYIAKEVEDGVCKEAVLEHEHKHVKLDRLIMNKYAYEIGHAVRQAVDNAGAMGPYTIKGAQDIEEMQQMMIDNIHHAVSSKDIDLHKQITALQGAVDSKSEYMRISQICHDSKGRVKKVIRKRPYR